MMWMVCRMSIPPPPQHLHLSIFVDSTLKFIDNNGELLDSDGIIGADVNTPVLLSINQPITPYIKICIRQ